VKKHLYVMSNWITSCLNGIESQGRDKTKIIKTADLDSNVLSKSYVSAEDVQAIFVAAEKLYGPLVGLEVRFGIVPSAWGCLSLAILLADDIRGGIQILVRQNTCLTNVITFFFEDGSSPCFGFRVSEGLNLNPVIVQGVIAVTVRIFRFLRSRDTVITAIDIALPKPADPTVYEEYYRVPIRWGTKHTNFHLDNKFLSIKSIHANPQLLKQHESMCTELLSELKDTASLFDLKNHINEALKRGEASIQQVAISLNISVRTLQRQLSQENTNFQAQLDLVRQKLAKRYIEDSDLSISDIAYKLSFSDSSNFSRAFNRWFSCTPVQYRSKHA
jgi:AraC-like DNA-binding protein